MANPERNKKILLDLMKQPGNHLCADCGAPDPDWASYVLGIFVCLNCSGTHRDLPAVSRVKSIRLDYWEDSLVEFMREKGNTSSNSVFEKCIPAFFYQPQQKDCVVLRDQWIRAKYERREFTGENNEVPRDYNSDILEAALWKKGKNKKAFLKRTFLLCQREFTLRYFVREDSKVPKRVIYMKDLNAVFQPEKMGHAHGLQISYQQEERTRNLFVYHERGQVIVSWFNAIRATKLAYLKRKHPAAQDNVLVPLISRCCVKEGYMEKTGPLLWEPFKKRWFTLSLQDRKLLYFKTPMDATELGAVFIGMESHGYSVDGQSPAGRRQGKWNWGIAMTTPGRQFIFMCEQEQDQGEWLEALREVISTPMTLQDYSNEANWRRRRK
ncbi:unnamed protein product [Boreogadus saida]